MNPELQNSLAALANKLGVSAEHLWPILVAREKLGAGIGILVCGSIAIASLYAGWKGYKNLDEDWDFPSEAVMYSGVLIGVLFLGVAFANIPSFIYPEASAIQSLVSK